MVSSILNYNYFQIDLGSPYGLVANILESGIVENEFELQSGYNVHFRTNTLGKGTKSLILQPCVK